MRTMSQMVGASYRCRGISGATLGVRRDRPPPERAMANPHDFSTRLGPNAEQHTLVTGYGTM